MWRLGPAGGNVLRWYLRLERRVNAAPARPLDRPAVLRCAQMPAARARPVVVASANGHQHTNGGAQTCVERAFAVMTTDADVLDALVAGVTIVELDPADTSVGYGALPNADGIVQLDAGCMHGPAHRAGAVAALEGVATAALVAKAVLEETPHVLLAGAGAQRFARERGFTIHDDLTSPRSRALWQEWRRRCAARSVLDPTRAMQVGYEVGAEMSREGLIDPNHFWGTISCNGVNARGDLAAVTTTSGLAWKIAGRVGDSPVPGAGLYVRDRVGAAGSTGRGESNLELLSSFAIVEALARGRSPLDAGMEVLRAVHARAVAARLLDADGRPAFNVKFYIVNAAGDHAGVALRGGDDVRFAVCSEHGAELKACEALLAEPT
jgi:N4-(beta-N-acetylglucosaminyl)-L-asparaginase